MLTIFGLAVLSLGGDISAQATVACAHKLKVSPVLISLTLLSFSTSLPELVVSLEAAFQGYNSIALGNIAGSNVANILLILGACALLKPLPPLESRSVALMLTLSSSLVFIASFFSSIGALEGVFFLAILILFTLYSYKKQHPPMNESYTPLRWPFLFFFIGLLLLLGGGYALVEGAVGLARSFHIPEAIIGLTVVALGTSLPELVVSIAAVIRGHRHVAMGTAVGSCIFNSLFILGVTALVTPVHIHHVIFLTIGAMLMASVVITTLSLWRKPLKRFYGLVFLACYGLYLFTLYTP